MPKQTAKQKSAAGASGKQTSRVRSKPQAATAAPEIKSDRSKIPKATKHPGYDRVDVERAMRRLRAFRRAGVSSLRRFPGRRCPESQLMLDAPPGYNPDNMRKARVFANADDPKGFTPAEFDALIAICEEFGFAMTVWHIVGLLSVQPKHIRTEFARRIAEERWSVKTMRDHLKQDFGRRRKAGRHHNVPKTSKAALTKIDDLCASWCRWRDDVTDAVGTDGRPYGDLLPDNVAKSFDEALKRITQLQRVVKAERDHLKSDRNQCKDVEPREPSRTSKR